MLAFVESNHQAFCTPRDGAGDMKMSRSRRPAGEHEGLERLQVRVQRINGVLEVVDLLLRDAQRLIAERFRRARRGQIGAEIEKCILDCG